jgi:DNA (cytosine-5)-methyltransferase 1
MNDLTWAPIIPLIGGFSLGAEMAAKKPPVGIYSYGAFAKNDSHYVHYQNETLKRNIPYYALDNEEVSVPKRKIDIMVATPPCAGLSQLNTGKKGSEKGSGSCAVQNEWMYRSAIDAIENFSPTVIIGENAPTLYTKMGEGVVENLYEIAQKHDYSLALYKTTTYCHGLPQKRLRCFYFLFKTPTTPVLNFYNRELVGSFQDYLKEIPKDASLQDYESIIRKDIMNEPYYMFLQHKFKKEDVRDDILEKAFTAHAYVVKEKLMDEYVQWAESNHEKGYELGVHAQKKFSDGKGVWDGSVHVFRDHMNALIGRALAESIHPNENRSLNVREALHMMGFPSNFELLGGRKNTNHIAQNVPTFTARDMVSEAMEFIGGRRQLTNANLVRFNNIKQRVDTPNVTSNSIERFLQ